MRGITLATYRKVYGRTKTVNDLKRMSDAQWDYIYKTLYWDKWQGDKIMSQSLANLLVDWYWMSGIYGIKIPQRALGLVNDGIVGPKTLSALNNGDEKDLFNLLWKERRDYFNRIGVGKNAIFLKGWMRRLNGIQFRFLTMNNKSIITF